MFRPHLARAMKAAPSGSRQRRFDPLAVAVALVVALGACGQSPILGAPPPGAGAAPASVATGPITGYGSIFVSDARWLLAGAAIDLDGVASTEDALRVGMVVRVEGTPVIGGVGTATRVVYDEAIRGTLDANPAVIGPGMIQFTILGNGVVAEEGVTQFAGGASLAGLMANDPVEVSGLIDDNGDIVATRIELLPPGMTGVELKGTVVALMRNISEFTLGGVTVLYDPNFQGTLFENGLTSHQDLMDGQRVEVEGRRINATRIEADRIALRPNALGADEAGEARLRGFIAGYVNNGNFSVEGVPVDARAASLQPPGLALMNGRFVDVSGILVGGVLQATTVWLKELDDRDGDLISIEASVGVGGLAAFGPGTLDLVGIEVQTTPTTRYDDSRSGVPMFAFGDIAEGDWLAVRARRGVGNAVVATSIDRRPLGTDVLLQGPVTFLDANATLLSILGRPITRAPGVTFADIDGMPLLEAGFFGAVGVDDVVRAVDVNAISPAALGAADQHSIELLD